MLCELMLHWPHENSLSFSFFHSCSPKHKLPLYLQGKIPFGVVILLVIAIAIHGGVYYNLLPDRVATHFDFQGLPDAYGGKLGLVLTYILTGGGIGLFTLVLVVLLGLECCRAYAVAKLKRKILH